MAIHLAEDTAFPSLLNRAEAQRNVAAYFPNTARILGELVDYGTFLIPRCLNSSPKELVDVVAITIFAKQAVAMLDGAHILIENGIVRPGTLQLRAIFEVSIYLDWLLAEQSDERATAYYTWNLRRKRVWILRAIPGTPEQIAFSSDVAAIGSVASLNEEGAQRELRRQLEEVNTLLAGPDYSEMNARFDVARGGRPFDSEWYKVLMPQRSSNLRGLSRAVGRMPEYQLIYEIGSEETHASRSDRHIRVTGDSIGLRALRDLSDLGLIAQLIMGEIMHIYRALLARYRPTENENFSLQYVQKWRAEYLNPRAVKYEYTDGPIDS